MSNRGQIIMLIIAIIVFNVTPLLYAAEDESFFCDYLEHKILISQSKAYNIDSKSECMRKTAQEKILMGYYLKKNKERIIMEILSENIEPKPYKIDYFLNVRYSEKWNLNIGNVK